MGAEQQCFPRNLGLPLPLIFIFGPINCKYSEKEECQQTQRWRFTMDLMRPVELWITEQPDSKACRTFCRGLGTRHDSSASRIGTRWRCGSTENWFLNATSEILTMVEMVSWTPFAKRVHKQ